MKTKYIKHLLIIVILSLSVAKNSEAQTLDTIGWCPPGATWVYAVNIHGGYTAYIFRYTQDTIVSGQEAKKIMVDKYYTWDRNLINPVWHYRDTSFYFELMYESGDTVYWWDDNKWSILYCFNAKVGDRIPLSNSFCKCLDVGSNYGNKDTLTVGGIYYDTLNGIIYPYYTLAVHSSNIFSMGPTRKNIGNTSGMFPHYTPALVHCDSMQVNYGPFSGLVCYQDLLRGFVNRVDTSKIPYDFRAECHTTITGLGDIIEDKVAERRVYVNPNPGNSYINVKSEIAMKSYVLYSINGQVVGRGQVEPNNRINIEQLNPGNYFISLYDKDRNIYTAQIIKE